MKNASLPLASSQLLLGYFYL